MNIRIIFIALTALSFLISCEKNDSLNQDQESEDYNDTLIYTYKDTLIKYVLYENHFSDSSDIDSWNFEINPPTNIIDTNYIMLQDGALELGVLKTNYGNYARANTYFHVEDSIIENMENIGIKVKLREGDFQRASWENNTGFVWKTINFGVKGFGGVEIPGGYQIFDEYEPEGNVLKGKDFDFYYTSDSLTAYIDDSLIFSNLYYTMPDNVYATRILNSDTTEVRIYISVNDPWNEQRFEILSLDYLEIYTMRKVRLLTAVQI